MQIFYSYQKCCNKSQDMVYYPYKSEKADGRSRDKRRKRESASR